MTRLCKTAGPMSTVMEGDTTDPTLAVIFADANPMPAATAVVATAGFVPGAAGSEPSHTSRMM